MARGWIFFVGLAGFSQSSLGDNTAPERRPSPQRRFEVAFEPARPDFSLDPDQEKPTAGLKSVRYNIAFYRHGSRATVAATDYYDIQASPSQPFPTPVSDILHSFIWSPEQDFVILPKENWPPNRKKDVYRRAVSLNTDYAWQTTEFRIEEAPLVWIDPLTVAGNVQEGCRLAVGEFSARTGKMSLISQAAPPAGYTIASSSDKSILLKKVLSSCATAEDRKFFVPECSVFDLRFKRREIGSCPP